MAWLYQSSLPVNLENYSVFTKLQTKKFRKFCEFWAGRLTNFPEYSARRSLRIDYTDNLWNQLVFAHITDIGFCKIWRFFFVEIRGVFKTLSNIEDRAFSENKQKHLAPNTPLEIISECNDFSRKSITLFRSQRNYWLQNFTKIASNFCYVKLLQFKTLSYAISC